MCLCARTHIRMHACAFERQTTLIHFGLFFLSSKKSSLTINFKYKRSTFKGYRVADSFISPQNCMDSDTQALSREAEVNTEPFFIRGDWLTVSSTHAASIKLPFVSTHLSGKHLLNPKHCAEEPKHNVWRCGCVRHIN